MSSEGVERPLHRGVEVACEHCGARMDILPQSFGEPVRCVECGRWFRADAGAFERARRGEEKTEETLEIGEAQEPPPEPTPPPPPTEEETEREEVEEQPETGVYRCPDCGGEMEREMSHCPFCGASREGDRRLTGFDFERDGWRAEQVEEYVRSKRLQRWTALAAMAGWAACTLVLLIRLIGNPSVPDVTFLMAAAASVYIFWRVYKDRSALIDSVIGCLGLWVVANMVWLFVSVIKWAGVG